MKPRARANGEGSIYPRSDGRWCAAYVVAGQRRVYYGDTKGEAVRKLNAAKASAANGIVVATSRLTVGAYLEQWLAAKRGTIRESSWKVVNSAVQVHLIPLLGSIRLAKLTPEDVERMMRTAQNHRYDEPISPRMRNHLRKWLADALAVAQRRGLVTANVAALAAPAKVERYRPAIWTAEQCQRFLTALPAHPYGPMFLLMVCLGSRKGEASAIHWEDLDLDAGTLYLQRGVSRGRVGPLKTDAQRLIALPRIAVDALRTYREDTLTLCGIASGIVFQGQRGGYLGASTIYRDFRTLATAADLPTIRVHDLRHSAATILLEAGVPLVSIQTLLGHSSISITADVYSHVSQRLMREAASAMDEKFTATRTATKPQKH